MKRCWSWPLWLTAAWMGAGCTGASLVATVTVPTELKSTCIRVVALAGGTEITSQLVANPGTTTPLLVAIFEPQGRERPVTLVARGYVGLGCSEPLLLNDESPAVTADFKAGPGGTAELALEAPPPELDGDRDGYRTSNAGGPDCDDRRSSVRPDISEVCGDVVDNDCDGEADCEEAFCVGQPCGGGRVCTQRGTCEGRETLCTNAVDDDLDGLTDCLDLDCLNVACDDGDLCSTGDRCVGGQCAGMPVTCSSPGGNACLSSSGSCNPADGGCVYPALAGQGCGGSNVCDHDGGCGPLYPYSPSNFTPPAATTFVPLRFECGGTVTLDTTPGAATVWGGGTALCGQVPPMPIDRPQTGAGSVAVIPVERLFVASGTDFIVSGSRPVIFAVFGDAQLDGRLWFNPGQGTAFNGPGVIAQCNSGGAGQPGAGSTTNGGGGGGGGGYGTAGSSGGQGSGGTAGGGPSSTAGGASLSPLIGGCAGGYGGSLGGPNPGGGGGAIQISATASLIVRGAVSSQGGGGPAGRAHQTGGGGGGSGGAVLLEARSVRVSSTGIVATNGGGGGGGDGCCVANILDGAGGGTGDQDSLTRAGGGGGGAGTGGAGGLGAAGSQPSTNGGGGGALTLSGGVVYQSGGGGGGGGLGRIRINAATDCQLDGGQYSGAMTTTGCP